MATILEILAMSQEKRRKEYGVKGVFTDNNGNEVERYIDKVVIDGTPFTDYKAFSFLWEKSYIKSPVRSGDGSIGNLNSYSTFLTPHLKIDFGLMSIDSYRILMSLIYSKNEFTVTCYDVINNKQTTNKMYFSTEEMPKLWTIVDALNGNKNAIMLLGVQDYTVEMIGTNASFDIVEVLYYDNNGTLISEATQQVDKGTEVIIGYDFVAPIGYRFDGKWKKSNGEIVSNGETIRLNDTIKLYADIVATDEYTLYFSYGNGNVLYSQTAGAINSITIKEGQTINEAIANANITLNNGSKFTFPTEGTGGLSVEYEEGKYKVPYAFVGWHWTPEANLSTRVDGNTKFDYKLNRTIYQIYEPILYSVSYVTNVSSISFNKINVKYGDSVPLPQLNIQGFTFLGWYLDAEFKTQFNGTMPPKSIIIYAKWEKNSQ